MRYVNMCCCHACHDAQVSTEQVLLDSLLAEAASLQNQTQVRGLLVLRCACCTPKVLHAAHQALHFQSRVALPKLDSLRVVGGSRTLSWTSALMPRR
jgi:hypothetical protein